MKKIVVVMLLVLSLNILQKIPAWGDEFKKREAVIAQYKKWLDTLGPEGLSILGTARRQAPSSSAIRQRSILPRGLSQPGTFRRYLFKLSRRPSGKVYAYRSL